MEEKVYKQLVNGNKVIFTLLAFTDDFNPENPEGAYTCDIQIINKENKVVEYFYRLFLVQTFNEKHYHAFIRKFIIDPVYRDQFNRKLETSIESLPSSIDPKLIQIIAQLNEEDLHTKYCCQGTNDPWRNRPAHNDGHSITAYILFQNHLPKDFLLIAQKYRLIDVGIDTIYMKRREDNIYFSK